jgi:hypothetical protein
MKFDRLRDRLRQGPATLPGQGEVTLDDFTAAVSSSMYDLESFPATGKGLQDAYDVIIEGKQPTPVAPRALPALPRGRPVLPPDAYSYTGHDAFLAVNCADAPLPRTPGLYPPIATGFEAAHPTFGRAEAFSEVGCANWPRVGERYAGPWNRRTARTVLVVNGTYDPATPYRFGHRMSRELGNARLLTLDGYGHTSQWSACVQGWYTKYLLGGQLPPEGTRCAQDRAPFPAPA